MGAKGNIPNMDVQGEEDVPHFEDTWVENIGEEAIGTYLIGS